MADCHSKPMTRLLFKTREVGGSRGTQKNRVQKKLPKKKTPNFFPRPSARPKMAGGDPQRAVKKSLGPRGGTPVCRHLATGAVWHFLNQRRDNKVFGNLNHNKKTHSLKMGEGHDYARVAGSEGRTVGQPHLGGAADGGRHYAVAVPGDHHVVGGRALIPVAWWSHLTRGSMPQIMTEGEPIKHAMEQGERVGNISARFGFGADLKI